MEGRVRDEGTQRQPLPKEDPRITFDTPVWGIRGKILCKVFILFNIYRAVFKENFVRLHSMDELIEWYVILQNG